MADEWPISLLIPRDPRWSLQGASMTAGRPAAGPPRAASLDGGPFWMCEHNGVWVRTAAQVRVARALEALADGGATEFVVPSCELRYAPGTPTALSGVPFSDDATFDDGSEFDTSASNGTVAVAAALRATSIQITLPSGRTFEGGEDFSIEHPTKGHRRYRVAKVTATVGTTHTVTIRPPLREALTGGEYAEFERPKCLMRLTNAADFFGALRLGRHAEANPVFVEAF